MHYLIGEAYCAYHDYSCKRRNKREHETENSSMFSVKEYGSTQ